MKDLPRNGSETLREDVEFVLSRRILDEGSRVLVLTPASAQPTTRCIQRLEHEYALRDRLDSAWAVRPRAYLQEDGHYRLDLDDPGGQVLSQLTGKPWEVRAFLRVAGQLAATLRQVHERGLIHKDIKPGNILVDLDREWVRFTGFGIASMVARERGAPDPPQVIAGTLAYMAPEQTGRMNRSVDSRSDLYALGITLFEMLTGELPFTATEPMEWVHCHLAKQPPRADERVKFVPEQLAAIVAKLLSKPAERRYQTAAGLQADLRTCLEMLETSGHVSPFPLGTADIPDRLILPEKLYGRERDVMTLVQAFERVVVEGQLEVVLVSGYSGIGKSSVVNELHKALVPGRALFASGKFDQYKRDIPYSTLAQALASLVRMILAQSQPDLIRWREEITAALGPSGRLVSDLVPELALVIGPQPPVPELPPGDAQNRFQLVLRQFLGVFATHEHPTVLFLDDIQWLDAATLKLIETLITQQALGHLLFIGAYRDNEVHAAHPLTPVLDLIRRTSSRVHEILLAPLQRGQVAQLVADALHATPEGVAPLADLVYEKAGGNPYFTIEFLSELAHEALLTFRADSWVWDIERIRGKGYTDNVVELMAGRLSRLGPTTQPVLKQLACLGNATRSTLALICGAPEERIAADLWDATCRGIVNFSNTTYSFSHDRVHEAAYSLIPVDHRAQTHLEIGRVLLARLGTHPSVEELFDAVSQLNRALELIAEPAERERLRRLNLEAGRRAKGATAYAAARTYLAVAESLSAPEAWVHQYAETFELQLVLAECEFMVGEMAAADARFEELLRHASSTVDRVTAACRHLQLYQVAGRYAEGLARAARALQLFDVTLPDSPADIAAATDAEYRLVRDVLEQRTIAEVADGPQLTDPSLRSLMDVLVCAAPCAFIGKPALFPLVTIKAVTLSLRSGNTEVSCCAYASFAVMLISRFADIPKAGAISEMALRLNAQIGKPGDRGSILMKHSHMVAVWLHPFNEVVPIQEEAFRTCLEVGDLAYAAYTAFLTIWQLVERGDQLDDVLGASTRYAAFARQSRNDAVYETIRLEQQFVASLQGKTFDPLGMRDATFDEEASFGVVRKTTFGTGIGLYYVMKEILAFHQGRYAEALAVATDLERYLPSIMALAVEATHRFVHALTLLALMPAASSEEKPKYATSVADTAARFARWAALCPENFGTRRALLLAEIARSEHRDLEAMQSYEEAIESARRSHRVQDEALALELAGRFYEDLRLHTSAREHLRMARRAYARWGARGKVDQLERAFPYLAESTSRADLATTIGTSIESLDLATVVRVLQALGSEIELDRWIATLMTTALQDAGAQRGVLLVPNGEDLRTLAEAVAGEDGVQVNATPGIDGDTDLPSAVLRYVVRTRETVVLDDAPQSAQFAADPYVVRRASRSLLCLPLVKQARLEGVLYLENNLAPCIFTPRRTALLKLIASQAAISLENARLYSDLRRENDVRRTTEDALQLSQTYLSEAQRMSRTGSFRWAVATGKMALSQEASRLGGFEGAPTIDIEDAFKQVPLEDAKRVREELARAAATEEPLDYDHRYVLADGTVNYFHVRARPIRDRSGKLEFLGAVMDVTEQRQAAAALQHAQAELAHVMRVTSLGELAASIAHEVNQPLTAISADASAGLNWLSARPPNTEGVRVALQAIAADSERAGEILARIRRLLARSPVEHGRCEINALVLGVLPLARSRFERDSVTVETALATDVPPVEGDPVQLQQVLLNLLLNAADASKDLEADRRHVVIRSGVELRDAKPWALVSVADAGKGIEPTVATKLFDAFYTTKPDGLGMGLSISRSIVVRHEGRLEVASNPDHGVTFTVSLPGLA